MPKRKIKWSSGDVFAVPLSDGTLAVGQVLDLMMVNQVRLALYDERVPTVNAVDVVQLCNPRNLISLVASSREELDYGGWKILGSRPVTVPIDQRPNEQFRDQGWVGAVHYSSGVVEKFFEAFYSLRPWDSWFDPHFLDKLLVDVSKRPKGVILTKSPEGKSE